MMCEKCIYRKNCQFLFKHRKAKVASCTAFKSEAELKNEAIRKFAERLKEKATSTFYEERKYVDTEDIDELLKEMTEEKK